jgi:hypothetical protein
VFRKHRKLEKQLKDLDESVLLREAVVKRVASGCACAQS